jgi:3-dehydroquinate dehydratase
LTGLLILFTVRTVSQGGKFPDEATQDALALMKLAVTLGCQYMDMEITWPSAVIESILVAKENSKIVASYHEFSRNVRLTSQRLQDKCLAAEAISGMLPTSPLEGISLTNVVDIIKLCVRTVEINDSLELGLYVRDYQWWMEKPIIVVAMGLNGQLS